MKLQIDTKARTIKIDENVKFNELIKVLDKLLPKEWKEYTLESNCTITWGTYPVYLWTWREPWTITCGTSKYDDKVTGVGYTSVCGDGRMADTHIYNVEIN
jgi:hypothetical protein